MGSWNQTCAVTGNSIFSGEDVVIMWIMDGSPLPFYIRGRYDDYGGVENEEGVMLEDVVSFFKEHLHEVEAGENKYHDIPVKKNKFTFATLMEADHEERLSLDYERRWDDHEGPRSLTHIQIKADVFDNLAGYVIDHSWTDYVVNVDFFRDKYQEYFDLKAAVDAEESEDEKMLKHYQTFELRSSIGQMFGSTYGQRLCVNTYWFSEIVGFLVRKWEKEETLSMDKLTNVIETFMFCAFMEHAGRALTRPSYTGQEDNCDQVERLAELTLATSQITRQRFEE